MRMSIGSAIEKKPFLGEAPQAYPRRRGRCSYSLAMDNIPIAWSRDRRSTTTMCAQSRLLAISLGSLTALTLIDAPARAQAQTFAGKNVTMVIGFGPGGGYDLWGRMVARH